MVPNQLGIFDLFGQWRIENHSGLPSPLRTPLNLSCIHQLNLIRHAWVSNEYPHHVGCQASHWRQSIHNQQYHCIPQSARRWTLTDCRWTTRVEEGLVTNSWVRGWLHERFHVRFHVRFAVNRRCDLLYLRFGVAPGIARTSMRYGVAIWCCDLLYDLLYNLVRDF
jgi:hypothetical protein